MRRRLHILMLGGLCCLLFIAALLSLQLPSDSSRVNRELAIVFGNASQQKAPVESLHSRSIGRAVHRPLHVPTDNTSWDFTKIQQNVEKCVDAANLTRLFVHTHDHGSSSMLDQAVSFAKNVFSGLKDTIQHDVKDGYCWKTSIEFVMKGRSISGKLGDQLYHSSNVSLTLLRQDQVNAINNQLQANYKSDTVCLPKAFVAGFIKCGSTTLHQLLVSHPYIVNPLVKEPRWWVNKYLQLFSTEDKQDSVFLVSFYLIHFTRIVSAFEHGILNTFTVDSTADLVYEWPGNWMNFCLLPSVIPQVLPSSKFMIVMRNPVDLLYSSFWFSCTSNQVVLSAEQMSQGKDIFHLRVSRKLKLYKDCFLNYSVERCVFDENLIPYVEEEDGFPNECGWTKVSVAIFYVHVQKWLSVVERNRLLFLSLEADLGQLQQQKTRNIIWDFLGLSRSSGQWVKDIKPSNVQYQVDYKHDLRYAMRNDTRNLLKDFYEPLNQRLADLLDDKKYLWTD